ncbi:AgrD family cyclic lactone autoinducer peptide [Paenibacillus sp. CN-4]
MRTLAYKMTYTAASLLAAMALVVVRSMSVAYVNQPEVPEELLK